MKKLSFVLIMALVAFALVSCEVKKDTENNTVDNGDIGVTVDENDNSDVSSEITPEPEKETVTLTLYFPDNDALYLHPEQREVELSEDDVLEMVVIEELFKGPENENLSPALDGEDLLISAVTNGDTCTVDFTEDFAVLNTGGSTRETFVIGSIVNSLCELDGIEKVKINIGGNPKATFGGHFTLESPFAAQKDLIKQ